MKNALMAGALLAITATSANAVVINYNYNSGYHPAPFVTAGSNGAANDLSYGDGPTYGSSPQNKCINGYSGATPKTCDGYTIAGQTVTYVGNGNGTLVNGNNGTYNANSAKQAQYAGTVSYDNSITFNYTDLVTNVTDTWYAVTGGSLAWTGAWGFEVEVAASATAGSVGGSWFTYTWTNGGVNLTTGARTGTAVCDLGIAGSAVVGSLLCGVANPASSYAYANTGTYVKPTNWAGVRELGDGSIELLMYGNRYTATGGGNNLQERVILNTGASQVVPVPGAVWLFGSALGLLGVARRRLAA
jgi:hypothetical protein